MLCVLLGAAGALALAAGAMRRRRRAFACAMHGWGPVGFGYGYGHPYGHGPRGPFAPFGVSPGPHDPWGEQGYGAPAGGFGVAGGFGPRGVAARLGLREDQEPAVREALSDLWDRLRDARKGLRKVRGKLADAVKAEVLDEVALGDAQAELEGTVDGARKAVVDAVAKVHGVLDERQRRALAAMLAGGVW